MSSPAIEFPAIFFKPSTYQVHEKRSDMYRTTAYALKSKWLIDARIVDSLGRVLLVRDAR
jgi:hypothetical protein